MRNTIRAAIIASVILVLSGCPGPNPPAPGSTGAPPTGGQSATPAAPLFPLAGAAPVTALKVRAGQKWLSEQVAGSDMADFADGIGDQASLNYPWDLAVNGSGDVFVADRFNHRVRLLKAKQVSTLAGQREPGLTDGKGGASRFNNPQGLGIGPAGEVYVADTGAGALRRVQPDGSVSTLLRDLDGPGDVVAAANGNLILAEASRHRLLLWSAASRQMQVLSGQAGQGRKDGSAAEAQFFAPRGLALGSDGTLYIADTLNHLIRKMTRDGQVSTLAGSGKPEFRDGKGAEASFNEPSSLALDGEGNLIVVDVGNGKVRRVTPAGEVSSLELPSRLRLAQGVALNQEYLWLSDSRAHAMFRLQPTE